MNKAESFYSWIVAIFGLIGLNRFTDALAQRDDWGPLLQATALSVPWIVWMIVGLFIVPAALRGPDFD